MALSIWPRSCPDSDPCRSEGARLCQLRSAIISVSDALRKPGSQSFWGPRSEFSGLARFFGQCFGGSVEVRDFGSARRLDASRSDISKQSDVSERSVTKVGHISIQCSRVNVIGPEVPCRR